MTIAAGMLYRGGAILFADTQIEAGAMKTHAPKVGMLPCSGGWLGFAMAGNAHFALSTIQKCRKALERTGPEDVRETLEHTLDEEHRRLVFSHPKYGTDWTLGTGFCLPIGLSR